MIGALRITCVVGLLAVFATAVKADDVSIEAGENLFRAQCDYCHGRGIQKGGTGRLEKRYKGTVPSLLEERTDLTPILIWTFVRTPTPGMAPFRPTEITDDELKDLIAYLTRNN